MSMIKIFCDGGARGNPGPAAYGFVVYLDHKLIKKGAGFIGIATNNFAEYTALIAALKWLASQFQGQDLEFNLDSQLVASQLSGTYKIKNAKIREHVVEIKALETNFGQIRYRYIRRELNREADSLVNQTLDEQESSDNN